MDSEQLCCQLGDRYEKLFSRSERVLHVELLNSVRRPDELALHAEPLPSGLWQVTVCCADQLGMLSIIAGMFTANEIDVVSGDVFTVCEPVPHQPDKAWFARPMPVVNRKVLDIFQVRAETGLERDWWDTFRQEFAELIQLAARGKLDEARERVIERVSCVAREAAELESTLLPVTVLIDTEADPTRTILRITALDTLGFLFEFANALTTLNVNIDQVEVRTEGGQVDDTFWVTDMAGRKLTDAGRLKELRATAALIKQFTHLLPLSPDPAQALRQFRALTSQMLTRPDWVSELHALGATAVLRTLAELMGVSQFLWEDFLRMQHANLFPVVRDVSALGRQKQRAELERELRQKLARCSDHQQRLEKLNEYKDREMFRIDLRHITGQIEFAQFARELSELAEAVVQSAAELAWERVWSRYGQPQLASGEPCAWTICALGKFGGREIGFASDIELLFVYFAAGRTNGPEPADNVLFFSELVTEFLRTIRSRREGIFEIDLRLRPYGRTGSLATSLAGFRQYFSDSGGAEQFERMALVKLRPVAGDERLGQLLIEARDTFVYSGRPLDYDNIRHLRHRQVTELVAPGTINAKYSPGGLVDIEYFVQARQIEVGAKDPSVRVTSTLRAIERLAGGGHMEAGLAAELTASYGFFRRLIDALRVVRGHARDLAVPASRSREFGYLARRLGRSEHELEGEIADRMAFARCLWEPT